MKQFLALLAAAALGSAATVAVFRVQERKSAEAAAKAAAETKPASVETARPAASAKSEAGTPFEKPAGEARTPGQNSGRFGGRNGGGMFADVEGVPTETMAKIRVAAFKAMQSSEAVKSARNRLMELGKQAEYASDQEKMDMRKDFEYAMEDMRKAIHQAISEADDSIPKEAIDKVLDAMEERRKAMGIQGKKK